MSVTHDFKFEAPDGKKRAADALDNECVQILAKHYPNNKANAFLDWFTYSDNTIDGQSKKKAYQLGEWWALSVEWFLCTLSTIIFSNWIYTHTFVLNITEKQVFRRTIL